MVSTEVMSTELFKNIWTGFSEVSIIPLSHTHKHTVHCRHHSFRLIRSCVWILFVIKHPLCSTSCALWVPLTVFLFPMDELCCVVVKSNCFEHRAILHLHSLNRVRMTLSILIFSLPTPNWNDTHIFQKRPCLTWIYRLSYRSLQPMGWPGVINLVPLLVLLNVGISVMETWYL